MSPLWSLGIAAAERGILPDAVIRYALRRLARARLRQEDARTDEERRAFLDTMREAPVAPVPEIANEQHYEVPAAFFESVLGPHLKYSGCLWEEGVTTLGEAEGASLAVTARWADC